VIVGDDVTEYHAYMAMNLLGLVSATEIFHGYKKNIEIKYKVIISSVGEYDLKQNFNKEFFSINPIEEFKKRSTF
jgi:hypothetical protein